MIGRYCRKTYNSIAKRLFRRLGKVEEFLDPLWYPDASAVQDKWDKLSSLKSLFHFLLHVPVHLPNRIVTTQNHIAIKNTTAIHSPISPHKECGQTHKHQQ